MRVFRMGAAGWLLFSLVLAGAAAAEGPGQAFVSPRPEIGGARRGRAVWIGSIAALAAANVADAQTSWNRGEGNRVLAGGGGRFGPRGAAIKAGVNGLWVLGQAIALRKNARYRALAVVNFAAASIFGALAWRNHSLSGGGVR